MKKSILITNDDGIFAEGIQVLSQKIYEQFGSYLDLFIIAPDHEQSAVSHAITMHRPLRVEKVRYLHNEDLNCNAVTGTPADCVKLAVEYLLPQKPDLIISGINRGSNLGTDVLYSGTFSAALEGALQEITSVAVSHTETREPCFEPTARFICNLLTLLLETSLPPQTLLNVNVPRPEGGLREIEITRLGSRRYRNTFEERQDPRGKNYYWLAGELEDLHEEGTDVNAVKNGHISVTPVQFDITNYPLIESLKELVTGDMLENIHVCNTSTDSGE